MQSFNRWYVIFLVTAFSQWGSHALAEDGKVLVNKDSKVHLIAHMGDSFSSATLADVSLLDSTLSPPAQHLLDGMFGESANKNTLSWAGGDQIYSHFKRLMDWFEGNFPDESVKRINVAVTGVRTHGLRDQANEILESLKTGEFRSLKYVTVTIGGNDICLSKGADETSDQVFEQNIRGVVKILAQIEQDEPIRLLVSSIPRIPDLGKSEILEAKTAYHMSCRTFKESVHAYCENLVNWTSLEEYDAHVAKVAHKNDLLRRAFEEATKEYPKVEAVFSSSFFEVSLQAEWLSMDCFHPNKHGQEILSELLWNDQPWFH